MDLYSLNKDMLVKLVSTIREDTIKEYDEKLYLKFKNINHYDSYSFQNCHKNNCKKFQLIDENGEILYGNCDMIQCNDCYLSFCHNHKNEKCDC